jgi:hypothetical protein
MKRYLILIVFAIGGLWITPAFAEYVYSTFYFSPTLSGISTTNWNEISGSSIDAFCYVGSISYSCQYGSISENPQTSSEGLPAQDFHLEYLSGATLIARTGTSSWDGIAFPFLSTTHIVAVDPYDGERVATSSHKTLLTTVYVAQHEVDEGYKLKMSWVFNADLVKSGLPPETQLTVFNSKTFDLIDQGTWDYGSSTDISRNGLYIIRVDIFKPVSTFQNIVNSFNPFFHGGNLVSTTTTFIASTTNAYDDYVGYTQGLLNDISTTTTDYEGCGIHFNLATCAVSFFVWPGAIMGDKFNELTDVITHSYPLGIATRLIEIISASSSTSSLPVLSLSLPDDWPYVGGHVMDLDLGANVTEADNLVRNTFKSKGNDPKDIWEISMPFLRAILWTLFAFAVIHRLLGLQLLHGGTRMFGKGEKRNGITKDEYAYKEKLYQMSQRR